VLSVEQGCRLSGISQPAFLICRHIKPWRCSTDDERLDGENGLLFCPNADYLFARGLVSFDGNGDFLVSPRMSDELLTKLHIPSAFHANVGAFSEKQARYLGFHKDSLFLRAAS
jgi:putative restriction endonuclease